MMESLKTSSTMPTKKSTSELYSFGMQRKAQFFTNSVKCEHFSSVNSVLHDTHAVLKGTRLKEPEKLGSSVFDYDDIYHKSC